MFNKWFDPSVSGEFPLPVGMYYMCRSVWAGRSLFLLLSRLESRSLGRRLKRSSVDRPVYVTGIARAGTTITLEMLSRHPDVGTHQYRNLACPFLPYWFTTLTSRINMGMTRPVERIHRDGILVDRESPEMAEESLWKAHFKGLHDERRSNVLDGNVRNPAFERFYDEQIRKLLLRQGRSRYAAKNNNNVTRLEYILKIFPDARVLLVVRDPVNHIASLEKQQRIFTRIGKDDPRQEKLLNVVGHHEFGNGMSLINTGNQVAVEETRRLWAREEEVRGWAVYWDALYRPDFSKRERQDIAALTGQTAKRYGYPPVPPH